MPDLRRIVPVVLAGLLWAAMPDPAAGQDGPAAAAVPFVDRIAAPFPALAATAQRIRAAALGIAGADALPTVRASRQKGTPRTGPRLAAHGIRGIENGPTH
jgi:hypothetical protein